MTFNEPLTTTVTATPGAETTGSKGKGKHSHASPKTDFVRAHSHLTVSDIVKAAAKKGLIISTKLAYNVRSRDAKARAKAVKLDVTRPRKPGRAQRSFDLWEAAQRRKRDAAEAQARVDSSSPPPIEVVAEPEPVAAPSLAELEFRRVVLTLGTMRARRMLDAFEGLSDTIDLGGTPWPVG